MKEDDDKTAGELAKEKNSNAYLADKLKGSEQQVVDDMKKEEKRVGELNKYIKEEQESKIRLNKELKTKINALTESLKSQKQELAGNIAAKMKESEELKQSLNESRHLIDQYKLQIAQLGKKLNTSEQQLHQIQDLEKKQSQKLIQETQ